MSLDPETLYALTGCGIFLIGLYSFSIYPHLIRKILALNIAGAGVYLVLASMAYQGKETVADPVPHAMVLTGIVVAVAGTALALALAGRISSETGKVDLEEPQDIEKEDE